MTLTASLALAGALAACSAQTAAPTAPSFRFEDVTATHLPDSPLRNSMDVGAADLTATATSTW